MHPRQTEAMKARHDQRVSLRWAALAGADLQAQFRELVKNLAAGF
jgi:hypothetical protein